MLSSKNPHGGSAPKITCQGPVAASPRPLPVCKLAVLMCFAVLLSQLYGSVVIEAPTKLPRIHSAAPGADLLGVYSCSNLNLPADPSQQSSSAAACSSVPHRP